MARVLVNDESLTAIAEAIREKLDVETTYLPSQMATAIESIETGGTDLTSADEGKVVVESSGDYVLQAQTSRNISQNGTYDTTTNDEVVVSVSGGGGGSLYTNGIAYASVQQITDISGFTKIYDTSIKFGSNGSKVDTALGITDESTLDDNMNGGWSASTACVYDAENLIGAYAGYEFGEALHLVTAKFWIGRYAGQNKTLTATVQYLDGNGDWNDIEDLEVTTGLSYPQNVFAVVLNASIDMYGLRWIHKKSPAKSSSNNLTFFGMTMYEGVGTPVNAYIPSSNGLITPPQGYDGFGPIYIP